MATKTITPDEPEKPDVVAAREASVAAAAKSERLRVEAEAAVVAAREAAAAELEAGRIEAEKKARRARIYHQAVVAAGVDAIELAHRDEREAFATFVELVQAEPWGVALIDYLSAKQRAREWDARQASASLALTGSDNAVPSSTVFTPPPTIDPSSLIAAAIHRAADAITARREATLNDHRTAFIAGETDDPTPPQDRV